MHTHTCIFRCRDLQIWSEYLFTWLTLLLISTVFCFVFSVPVACFFTAGRFLLVCVHMWSMCPWVLKMLHPVCPLSVSCQAESSSVVVAGYNVSSRAGSKLVLQCVSSRMVWTRDRVRDRQRVIHWDMYRAYPDYAMERVVDMFSAGEQRMYNSYNLGRVGLNPTAFKDGNFSLVIKGHTHIQTHSVFVFHV